MEDVGYFARVGAVAAVVGAVIVFVSTMLHPLDAGPNDAETGLAEYAADPLWVASHLGQFLGFAVIGAAVLALARTIREGRAGAWAQLGVAGAIASVAATAALQKRTSRAQTPRDRRIGFRAGFA